MVDKEVIQPILRYDMTQTLQAEIIMEKIFEQNETLKLLHKNFFYKRNNEYVMTATFLFKAQFAAPNNENSTKQESTSFNHTTFEGSAYPLKNHKLYRAKEFKGETALEDAKAWLDAIVGITD